MILNNMDKNIYQIGLSAEPVEKTKRHKVTIMIGKNNRQVNLADLPENEIELYQMILLQAYNTITQILSNKKNLN